MSEGSEGLELRIAALEKEVRDLHERLDRWPILTRQVIRDWKDRLAKIERGLGERGLAANRQEFSE